MNEQAFKDRTRKFGLAVVQLVELLPRCRAADIIGRQLLRCGTSVGANYRSACRGKSVSDVIAKLAIVEEEADESIYWMDLLVDSHIALQDNVIPLRKEADELVAMTVASIKTLRARARQAQLASVNPKSKI
jgi:four helix bundle protein